MWRQARTVSSESFLVIFREKRLDLVSIWWFDLVMVVAMHCGESARGTD